MAINPRTIKVINKMFDAGFTTEKAILDMTIDDMLQIAGINIVDIATINDLKKCVKSNSVFSFLSGEKE